MRVRPAKPRAVDGQHHVDVIDIVFVRPSLDDGFVQAVNHHGIAIERDLVGITIRHLNGATATLYIPRRKTLNILSIFQRNGRTVVFRGRHRFDGVLPQLKRPLLSVRRNCAENRQRHHQTDNTTV